MNASQPHKRLHTCSQTLVHKSLFTKTSSQTLVHKRLFTKACSQTLVHKRLFTKACSQKLVHKHLFSNFVHKCLFTTSLPWCRCFVEQHKTRAHTCNTHNVQAPSCIKPCYPVLLLLQLHITMVKRTIVWC